jgi:endo-1,4-beta-xylanase
MKLSIIALLLCGGIVSGCGTDDPPPGDDDPPPTSEFVRPVVLAEQPLTLDNTNGWPVVWPIWGSSFLVADPVKVRVTMQAADGSNSGLFIAGPGDTEEVDQLHAVQLVRGDGKWLLRETNMGEVLQEQELAGASSTELIFMLEASGKVTVESGKGEASVEPSSPLAPAGQATGIYVNLAAGAQLEITDLAVSQPLPTATDLGAPLRELAAARGIEIGTATDIWPPMHDLSFEALLGEQFGVTAPTEFYWPTTRGEDEGFFFVPADLMVNYATVHGQRISGYFLVWDFALPDWVNTLAEGGDAAAFGAVFDEHISTTVSRYKGRVKEWIVVNEAIWGPEVTETDASELAYTIFSDVLGPEYIERAFVTARAADPDAVLMYNETGAEDLGSKSDFMYDMAADLIAKGAPIDAIGLQFHIDAAAPPDMAGVKANMERFAALGLDVYITELDVNLVALTGTDAENLEIQAQLYAQVLETCLAVPACRSYTIFGVSDKYAWDEQEGGSAAPLLFSEDYTPKPAFYAVQSVLQTTP